MTMPGVVAGAVATPPVPNAAAQWRSLEEVKQEVMRRAGRLSPFEDIRREDAAQVVDALTSLDRDLWAQLWSKIGLGYEAKANARARGRARPATSSPSSTRSLSTIAASAVTRCRARPGSRNPTGIRCACSARRRRTTSRR